MQQNLGPRLLTMIFGLAEQSKDTDRKMQETDRRMQETDRLIRDLRESGQETDRKMQETARELRETGRYIKELSKKIEGIGDKFGSGVMTNHQCISNPLS